MVSAAKWDPYPNLAGRKKKNLKHNVNSNTLNMFEEKQKNN